MQRLVHQSTNFSTTSSPSAKRQLLAWASIVLWVLMAGKVAGCAKCDSGSWVCMSFRLLAFAHVFYRGGTGYISIYQICEQMRFASECREQASEDTTDPCVFYIPVDKVKPCLWVEGRGDVSPHIKRHPRGPEGR